MDQAEGRRSDGDTLVPVESSGGREIGRQPRGSGTGPPSAQTKGTCIRETEDSYDCQSFIGFIAFWT